MHLGDITMDLQWRRLPMRMHVCMHTLHCSKANADSKMPAGSEACRFRDLQVQACRFRGVQRPKARGTLSNTLHMCLCNVVVDQ